MQSSLFNSENENLLPFQGKTILYADFLQKEEADRFLSQLIEAVPWRQEPIWMFGKKVMQPRLTALFGDTEVPYSYSGIQMEAWKWLDPLTLIREKLKDYCETEFTHVLLNYYRDGQDSMGWHRDNEASLGKNPTIASVSLGASRTFQIRHYANKAPKLNLELGHGSLLIMAGESQHFWEHQLPKTKKVLGPRVNLTFRKLS